VYKYIIEASADGKKWTTIVNHSAQAKDAPHDYVQLNKPVMARYLRISNIQYPGKGLFSIYDFRVFGSALGKLPAAVEQVVVSRNKDDQRRANVSWAATADADFYIVRYGIAPNKLYSNYQVYDANSIDINSLNTGVDYYFAVDAVNATGITRGKIVVR